MATPTITKQIISPAVAEEWLAKNGVNRPVTQFTVRKYAEDMRTKRWWVNGETIKFSETGRLLDGQHRLQACVLAGVPFETFVAYGLDEDAFATLDTGKSRKVSDVLHIMGYPSSTQLAALARMSIYFKQSGRTEPSGIDTPPSVQEIVKEVNLRSAEYLNAIHGAAQAAHRLGGGSVWGLVWMILGEIESEDRDAFFEKLASGEDLVEGDPIFALRRLLLDVRFKGRSYPSQVTLSYILKGWNAWRSGRNVRVLSVKANEPFPHPI